MAVYFWSFGTSAWHPTDYEHIMGFTWHVIHGEVPYRDFIYHKPPGTIFLHAVWQLFPDRWQVRASRLFFYTQMAGAGFLPIWWALARERIAFGWRLPLLGVTAVMLALHNFPPMPWQTTDGVMFATIGLVALVESTATEDQRRAVVARAIASATFAAAVLCKQSFFMPCVLLALVALGDVGRALLGRRSPDGAAETWRAMGRFAASALPALVLVGMLLVYLIATRALADALVQFQSQSSGASLEKYGLFSRSRYGWLVAVWTTLALVGVAGRSERPLWSWPARIAALPFLWYLARVARDHASEGFGELGFILFFMLAGALVGRLVLALLALALPSRLAAPLRQDPQMLLLHVGFVLIAWSCQLSLGYTTPILGIAGLGLVLHELLPRERSILIDVVPVGVACGVVAVAMWTINYERPYRDLRRPVLQSDLGQVFPKLAGIRTNVGTFARYVEIKDLITRHALQQGRQFVVTQDWPGLHWLVGDENPIACDWCWKPDITGFERRLLDELREKRPVVIIPKDHETPWLAVTALPLCPNMKYGLHNAVSQTISQSWMLIGIGKFFCVFGPPPPS